MKNIIETLTANQNFSTLITSIKAADLSDTLSEAGPYTVFAPTNQAFSKISGEDLREILADKVKLIAILTNHVIEGRVMSKDVANLTKTTTLGKAELKIDSASGVRINEATVTTADIDCTNGVIHAIDTVLMP